MAMFLWKPFIRKASVVLKTLMYSNVAPSRIVCSSERWRYSSRTDFVQEFRQLEFPETHKCCSSWFPLHLYIFPLNLSQNHGEIIFQTGNCSDQKLKNAPKHFRLLLVSLLAILGVKAFNSIPVLLADEINFEQNSSTEPNLNAGGKLNEDEACNESGGILFLDSLENDGTFSQVSPEDFPITDPIEISDVQSLKHSHVVREAAGVSAESALVLVIRASRALLAAIEDYRASLLHQLDLLSYNAVLINKLGQGAVYEEVLQQVTGAMVEAKARTDNSKNRVTDLQLLVRVSAQSVESLNLCCLLSGAEATALASSAAVSSLRSQVEAAEAEVRHLQADVLARQAEIIVMENSRRPQEEHGQGNEEKPEGEEKEPVVEEEPGVKESKKDSEFWVINEVLFPM